MGFVKHTRSRKNLRTRSDEILLKQVVYQNGYVSQEITIYAACWRKNFNQKNYVELYFDEVTRCIGFVPLDEPTEDSYKLTGTESCGSKSICCQKFFAENYIRVEDGFARFKIRTENGMLVCPTDPKLILSTKPAGFGKRSTAVPIHSENITIEKRTRRTAKKKEEVV